MRTITLHPSSLLAGAAIAALAFVTMAQQQLPGYEGKDPKLARAPAFFVHPRDYVQIEEGVPYVVPAGKLLTITALGSHGANNQPPATVPQVATLRVDGVDQVSALGNSWVSNNVGGAGGVGNGSSMKLIPRGFSIAAGSMVEVIGGIRSSIPDDARAWGYLVDA